jgi:hypothetical protein
MTIEQVIWSRLGSLVAVVALVSTRIYLDKLPQAPTYPCVRVTLVSDQLMYHLRGGGVARRAMIQVDAYAREVSGVDPYALVATVSAAIHGDDAGSGISAWSGEVSPFRIQGAFRVDRRRHYDPGELRVLTMSQDYQVAYRA